MASDAQTNRHSIHSQIDAKQWMAEEIYANDCTQLWTPNTASQPYKNAFFLLVYLTFWASCGRHIVSQTFIQTDAVECCVYLLRWSCAVIAIGCSIALRQVKLWSPLRRLSCATLLQYAWNMDKNASSSEWKICSFVDFGLYFSIGEKTRGREGSGLRHQTEKILQKRTDDFTRSEWNSADKL